MKTSVSMFAMALVLVAVHAAAELAGLRDWVSVLSGTPVPGVPFQEAALGGAFYVLGYFGAVLLAPILTLAALIQTLAEWAERRWRARTAPPVHG